ncbi:MAG: DUF1737 domain-containing protein [Rhodoferax sp.]
MSSSPPPGDLAIYRLLAGPDDASFCRRVSEAVAQGYLLYGSPSATFNGVSVIVAQAIIWPTIQPSIAVGTGSAGAAEQSRRPHPPPTPAAHPRLCAVRAAPALWPAPGAADGPQGAGAGGGAGTGAAGA